jgi:hypothetical protein
MDGSKTSFKGLLISVQKLFYASILDFFQIKVNCLFISDKVSNYIFCKVLCSSLLSPNALLLCHLPGVDLAMWKRTDLRHFRKHVRYLKRDYINIGLYNEITTID